MFPEQRLSISINFGPTKQEVRFIFRTLCLPDHFSLVPFYCFSSGHSYYNSPVKKKGRKKNHSFKAKLIEMPTFKKQIKQ